jgi:hypothetical protein
MRAASNTLNACELMVSKVTENEELGPCAISADAASYMTGQSVNVTGGMITY